MAVDLLTDLRWALSPADFAREALDFHPGPFQQRVLEWQGKRLALLCSRQAGKTKQNKL